MDLNFNRPRSQRGEFGESGGAEVNRFAKLVPTVFAPSISDLHRDAVAVMSDPKSCAELIRPTGAGQSIGVVRFSIRHVFAAPTLAIPRRAVENAGVNEHRGAYNEQGEKESSP